MKKLLIVSASLLISAASAAGTVRVYKQVGWENSSGNYISVASGKTSTLSNVTPGVRECTVLNEKDGNRTIGQIRCRQNGAADVSTMCTTGKDGTPNALLIFGNAIEVDSNGNAKPATPTIVAINCME